METTSGQVLVFAGRTAGIWIHACRLCLVGTGYTELCVDTCVPSVSGLKRLHSALCRSYSAANPWYLFTNIESTKKSVRSEHKPGFLYFFSIDLTSVGYMSSKNAGCQDETLEQFFLLEFRKLSITIVLINISIFVNGPLNLLNTRLLCYWAVSEKKLFDDVIVISCNQTRRSPEISEARI